MGFLHKNRDDSYGMLDGFFAMSPQERIIADKNCHIIHNEAKKCIESIIPRILRELIK